MNAPVPPFPPNPTVGQFFGSWCWNGVAWVPAPLQGVRAITTVFNASGTYIPSPGLVTVIVTCIGGGGGGGGVSANIPATAACSGAGGGSGGYSVKTLDASLVLGGVIVTVGLGGASNAQGGVTSFGALCVANGGLGANQMSQFLGLSAGHGATPGIGDIAMPGHSGSNGQYFNYGAASGSSMALGSSLGGAIFGGANTGECGPGVVSAGPQAYANTGAGGSGAIVNQVVGGNNAVQLGGQGGSGVCWVNEFCSVGGGAPDGCAPIPITDGSCLGWGGPWR